MFIYKSCGFRPDGPSFQLKTFIYQTTFFELWNSRIRHPDKMAESKKEGINFGSLFGGKKDSSQQAAGSGSFFGRHEEASPFQMSDLSSQINNLSRRMKMMEERHTIMRNKGQLTDQTLLESTKDIRRNVKTLGDELLELRKDFEDLKNKVKLIVKELKDTAKSEDVQILEKYISMWEPVNFVSKHDVERIVEDKMEEIMQNSENASSQASKIPKQRFSESIKEVGY